MTRRGPHPLDVGVPALVLKVGDYVLHHGGLAVVRTLGRAGVPVYGVFEDRFAPAGLSRYVSGRFIWPTAGQDCYQDQLLHGIERVADRIGQRAVIVPTDDHATMFVADHADVLEQWFLFAPQSPALVREVTDKAALYERCRALGVSVAPAVVARSAGEVVAYAEACGFPFVAKRCSPSLLPDGLRRRSTVVVRDRASLPGVDTSSPVLLQEYIPRDGGEDWLFHGYCDSSRRCRLAFTGRKLRSFPPDAGETALGRSESNPVLEAEARSLLETIGYSGIVSLDYRYDGRDGRYKLLDFNPRVGAIFSLFKTDRDVDVVRALHLDLTGAGTAFGESVDGRVVAVEGHDIRSIWSRRGELDSRAVLSSWRSLREMAWLAPDDAVPAAVGAVRATARAATRSQRRLQPAPARYRPGRAGRVQR